MKQINKVEDYPIPKNRHSYTFVSFGTAGKGSVLIVYFASSSSNTISMTIPIYEDCRQQIQENLYKDNLYFTLPITTYNYSYNDKVINKYIKTALESKKDFKDENKVIKGPRLLLVQNNGIKKIENNVEIISPESEYGIEISLDDFLDVNKHIYKGRTTNILLDGPPLEDSDLF